MKQYISFANDANKAKANIRKEYIFYLRCKKILENKPKKRKILKEINEMLFDLEQMYHGVKQIPPRR